MSTNTLQITGCDNELLVVAYQWGDSFELANIKSGQGLPVDVTISIDEGQFSSTVHLNGVNQALSGTYPTSLAAGGPGAGEYHLALIGVNWGGATDFAVTFNGQPVQGTPETGPGVVWTPDPIQFNVS